MKAQLIVSKLIQQKLTYDSPLWMAWTNLNLNELAKTNEQQAWECLLEAAKKTVPELVKTIDR